MGGWGGGERCGCGGREGAERAVEAAGAEGRRFEGEHIGSASFGRKCKSRGGASLNRCWCYVVMPSRRQ